VASSVLCLKSTFVYFVYEVSRCFAVCTFKNEIFVFLVRSNHRNIWR
jgi:hypothetical protein